MSTRHLWSLLSSTAISFSRGEWIREQQWLYIISPQQSMALLAPITAVTVSLSWKPTYLWKIKCVLPEVSSDRKFCLHRKYREILSVTFSSAYEFISQIWTVTEKLWRDGNPTAKHLMNNTFICFLKMEMALPHNLDVEHMGWKRVWLNYFIQSSQQGKHRGRAAYRRTWNSLESCWPSSDLSEHSKPTFPPRSCSYTE